MKKLLLLSTMMLLTSSVFSQKSRNTNLLMADKWEFDSTKTHFISEKNQPIMHMDMGAGKAIFKDLNFTNGTLEFDVKQKFMSFYFHYQDEKESECFYMRMENADNPQAMDGVQYAPVIDGVLLWDLYPHFQTNASFSREQWNHVKLEIDGTRMRLFINDEAPTMLVDYLAGNSSGGTIAFEGEMEIKNLRISPASSSPLANLESFDPLFNDPRYIREWGVSAPVNIPERVDFSYNLLPVVQTDWQVLAAERQGLLNLTRLLGHNEESEVVWCKVNIQSDHEQIKTVHLGFVDNLWAFLNGQLVYLGKNLQGRLMEKPPLGRIGIENASVDLPLNKGNNELLIGLGNDPYWGRGLLARFDDLKGIKVTPEASFDTRLIKIPAKKLEALTGNYELPNGTLAKVSSHNDYLSLQAKNFGPIDLYPQGEDFFFSRLDDLEFKFQQDTTKNTMKLILLNDDKQLLELQRIN